MKVTVKLFAAARDLAGQEEIAVVLPADTTIGDLRRRMAEQFPPLAPLLPHAVFAVDAEYASDETRITEQGEIACIPPVSGG